MINHYNKLLLRSSCKLMYQSFRMAGSEYHFAQKVNPLTGKYEWIVEHHDEHDYFTDIARSSYADMLHDVERNQMYYQAIKLAVSAIHARGQKCRVLDIGTGTGLLSMMAANAGADVISAIEVFTPVAELAKKITKRNGFQNINIINKHSTEVTCGVDGDMEERANLLVTELFDTELIGEGALSAYQHAHENLMVEDCLAVPHKATIFAQVVQSDLMLSWHKLASMSFTTSQGKLVEISPNRELVQGGGVCAVHDIQLSQFPREELTELTEPVSVFEFDWSSPALTDHPQRHIVPSKVKASGIAQTRNLLKAVGETKAINSFAAGFGFDMVVLSWWVLEMDQQGDVMLSTAPRWHHPTPANLPWRDHWMQSVYFLPREVQLDANDDIAIKASHDAFSLWFEVNRSGENHVCAEVKDRPFCEYPPRLLWSRRRLGMLNDVRRNQSYANALESVSARIPTDALSVCLSDFSLLPVIAAKICKDPVLALEQTDIGQRGLINLAKHNDAPVQVLLKDNFDPDEELAGKKIGLLAAEPFLRTSDLPWFDLNFWYFRSKLDHHLHESCQILPRTGCLYLAAVHFDDLWKIRAPVAEVEGFDVSLMDDLIASALEVKEVHEAEPHPLWEYPNALLTRPVKALTFSFNERVPEKPMVGSGRVQLAESLVDSGIRHCHAVVLWMEYNLDGKAIVSTGLKDRAQTDLLRPAWSMHHKQAVFFLRQAVDLRDLFEKQKTVFLNYHVEFRTCNGEMRLRFDLA